MISRLADWARLAPDRIALIDEDGNRRFTYAELAGLGRRAQARLQRLGLKPGERTAILSHNSAEQVALFFACQAAGVTLCPLNWRLAAPELLAVLSDYKPDLLAYDPEHADLASALSPKAAGSRVALRSLFDGPEPGPREAARQDPEAPALVLYTSGTTGKPKGAMLSTRMILANAMQTCMGWSLTEEDRTVTAAPMFHTGGWNVLTLPLLLRGGQVTLLRKFEADRVAALLREGRATVLFGVPTMFRSLLETGLPDSPLKFLISGGAPCPEDLLKAYLDRGQRFLQGFGLTEAGPNCFMFPFHEARRKAGSVGIPMIGTEIRLADASGQAADQGEIRIRGPHLFSGYLGLPEETSRVLADGWVRTGDIARRDSDGFFHILGRIKEMYISGGENVYPAEVEAVLSSHPGVLEAAVLGVPDSRWGETGAAFVVPRPGAALTTEDLAAFLRGRLARYKLPAELRVLDALPRNTMGKVLKSDLAGLLAR